jgi:hypothetical protein
MTRPQYKYDINSLYPFVMFSRVYPEPESLKFEEAPTVDRLIWYLTGRFEGMAKCTVQHKPRPFGYLPYTLPNKKLVFPTPDKPMTGYWCFPELREALNDGAIEIISCDHIVSGFRIDSPFKSFVSSLHKWKQDAEKAGNRFERMTAKLLMNSGYGKFGEQRSEELKYAEEYDFDYHRELNNSTGKEFEWCPVHEYTRDGYYKAVNEGQNKLTSHTLFCWASYITSWARVENLRWQRLIHEKGGYCYYTDTDSFVTDVELPHGDKLGDLKQEDDRFTAIYAPKDYRHIDYGKTDMAYFLLPEDSKIKGLPKDAVETDDNSYIYNTFFTEKMAIRRNEQVGKAFKMAKTLSRRYDKGEVMPDGYVRPLRVIE